MLASDPHTNAAGVIIGVFSHTTRGMSATRKDKDGRAVAACIPYAYKDTLLFVGLYGPSAAMSARFSWCKQTVLEENNLRAFVLE